MTSIASSRGCVSFFDGSGIPADTLPDWALRLALGLAREYHTPVPYWLALPLRELIEIVHTHNEMCDEAKKRAEAAR